MLSPTDNFTGHSPARTKAMVMGSPGIGGHWWQIFFLLGYMAVVSKPGCSPGMVALGQSASKDLP